MAFKLTEQLTKFDCLFKIPNKQLYYRDKNFTRWPYKCLFYKKKNGKTFWNSRKQNKTKSGHKDYFNNS